MEKFEPSAKRDKEILAHVKWASAKIFKATQDKNNYGNLVVDKAKNYIVSSNLLIKNSEPIKYYRFKSPLGEYRKWGIETYLEHHILIWAEKGIEYLEKPRWWFGEIKITDEKYSLSSEDFFIFNITDEVNNRSVQIALKEAPIKDSKIREPKTGKVKIQPIQNYISSFRHRTGLIPILIPKSLKEEQWVKVDRRNLEILFYTGEPSSQPKNQFKEMEIPRLIQKDYSYKELDYYMQMAIYLVQAGLLNARDCLLEDFRDYVFAKFCKINLDEKKSGDSCVEEVGYWHDEYIEEDTKDKYFDHISYNAPQSRKYKWAIDVRDVNDNVLSAAFGYITKSYHLPFNPTTFEVYVRKTIAGILKTPFRKPYQPKINPDRELRQEIIRLRVKQKKCSLEAARKWVYRKQADGFRLDEIYFMI